MTKPTMIIKNYQIERRQPPATIPLTWLINGTLLSLSIHWYVDRHRSRLHQSQIWPLFGGSICWLVVGRRLENFVSFWCQQHNNDITITPQNNPFLMIFDSFLRIFGQKSLLGLLSFLSISVGAQKFVLLMWGTIIYWAHQKTNRNGKKNVLEVVMYVELSIFHVTNQKFNIYHLALISKFLLQWKLKSLVTSHSH